MDLEVAHVRPAAVRPLRGRALWRRWTVATALGELAGFTVPAAVGVATAATGMPALPQALLLVGAGACEGSILGLAQAQPLRRALPGLDVRRWVAATAAGAAFAWGIGMVPATLGEQLGDLLAGVLAGGGALLSPLLLASIGTAQWLVLRRHARGAALWIPANAAAWTAGLAVCFAVIAFTAEGRSVAVNVGIVVLAGLGMGATVATVTGVALVRLLNGRHRRSGPPRWVNRLVGSVLRSPAHRLLSDSLALLVVRGRRTGTPVTVPVMYARTGDDLIVLVGDAAAGNGGATCAAAPRSSSCSEGTPVPPAPTSSPRRTPVRER